MDDARPSGGLLARLPLQFMLGAGHRRQFPEDIGAEVAFVGRSNAGKSSAINCLTGQRTLARTSKRPGRTQQINFFRIGETDRRIVDLPGYGYARVPERLRRAWRPLIEGYLMNRRSLRGLVVLVDCRRGLTSGDEVIVDWCLRAGLPAHVLLTKCDKLGKSAAASALLGARRALADHPSIGVQLFSSPKRIGIDKASRIVEDWLESD